MVASLPQLADGAYLVSWNVVLTDGDASSGEFNFYIGASGAVAATAAVSASTVKVAGLADSTSRSSSPLLIFGGVGVLVLVAGGIFFMRRRKTSA
jgi:LPXTG-motif cell wall-anchored protein